MPVRMLELLFAILGIGIVANLIFNFVSDVIKIYHLMKRIEGDSKKKLEEQKGSK
jgi:hypothetical protein